MNSKLFAICVILLVASVISLSEGNAVNSQFDQIDNVVSVSHNGQSETQHITRQKRDILCDELQCKVDCIAKGKLMGGKCSFWFFCSCH